MKYATLVTPSKGMGVGESCLWQILLEILCDMVDWS